MWVADDVSGWVGVDGGAVGAAEGVAGGITPLLASADSAPAGFHFGKEVVVKFRGRSLWRNNEEEEEEAERGAVDSDGRLWEEVVWRGGVVCEEWE